MLAGPSDRDSSSFYYYYIGNPSEAMIAKRRTHATIISYQAPALKKSGIYGELQELKETIAEYRESMQSAPERCDDLMNQIDHLAEACGCTGDLEQIEEYLYEYENSLITDGLHVMNAEEAQGLLHALDGEYVPVGTAGDVVKIRISFHPGGILCSLIRGWFRLKRHMSGAQEPHSLPWNNIKSRQAVIPIQPL